MKKIILGSLIILGLASVANADNLEDIHMSNMEYYVFEEKGGLCEKIDNKVDFKNRLIKRFGNVELKSNLEYMSGFSVYEGDKRFSFAFAASKGTCDNYRKIMNKTYVQMGREQLYTDILVPVAPKPTVSTINKKSLGYKLKVAYGESCTKIHNVDRLKRKILKKYGDINLTSNSEYNSGFSTKTKTGKTVTYFFGQTIHSCRNFQKSMNKITVSKGYNPMFPDIK